MTQKADFNAEEWSLVLEGPPTAGMMVVTAHKGGTLRESISLGKVYAEARRREGEDELLDEIVRDQPEFDQERFHSVEELRSRGLERLREAVSLLEQKATPEEVEDYKRFTLSLAETAARSHKEGGFLGIGGTEISDSENAVLDEIAQTLGIQRSPEEPS
jgi:hypothetical protein